MIADLVPFFQDPRLEEISRDIQRWSGRCVNDIEAAAQEYLRVFGDYIPAITARLCGPEPDPRHPLNNLLIVYMPNPKWSEWRGERDRIVNALVAEGMEPFRGLATEQIKHSQRGQKRLNALASRYVIAVDKDGGRLCYSVLGDRLSVYNPDRRPGFDFEALAAATSYRSTRAQRRRFRAVR